MFFRRRAVLVGLTLLLIITLFFSTVFASNFIDTSYSDFGLGSSYHTVVNPDGNVVLQSPDAVNYFSTGDFNSKIFDAGGSSQWNKFTFNPQIKYGALPNNACSSQATNDINMCGNVLMLHMDNITQNPNIVAGKVGNALNFDGNNDYVNIGNIGNVKTISYWVKSNSNGNGGIELNSNQYIDDSAIPEGLVNPVVYIDGVQTTLWGSEILTNGGEEAPYSSGIATGWSADGAGVTPTQETTIVHGGSSSQKIITTQQYTGLYQSLSLTNGTTYLVSGWAYISSGTPYVLVQQMGGAWPSYGNTALPSISSQWQYFRFYASSASYASPGLRENCLGATTWYIDDVSIKPVLIRYPVSDTSWHHVVITTSTSVIASAVKIGKGGSTYFNGSIDNIRTWGRELSAVEANSLYQSERNGIVQPDMNRTNLIGEWLFDENATSSWGIRTPDTSGYANHGTDTNMSGITTPDSSGNSNDGNLLTGAYLNNGTTNTGLWNTNAGVFDGVSGDINVPNFSKTIYAASFWVKPSSTITSSTDGKILLSFNVASEGDYISFGDSTGYCTNEILSVISGGSKRTCVTSATIPSINTSWHHIAISWDGSKYLIYYDGQNVATTIGTASGNSNLISSSFLNIASFGGTSNFFSGSIEDVAVWNRALSATEVTNIYKKGVARLKLQARSCAQSNCGDSNFSGTDRNVSNYFTDFNNPIDLNMFSNSRYFQYKATFETDDTNMGKGTTSMLLDVNIDYNTLNRVPDVNVVKIGGYLMTQGLPSFSYARDGNLVVDYNVFDADGGVQRIDLNYSLSRAQGTGTSIVQDFNLTSSNCARTDWNTLAVDCNYSFSLSGITDGNYFILAKITDDGNSTAFKASDLNFMIDNTKPIMSWDGNTGWQKPDQNIHLTCSDVNGSGCNTTTYRLDTNPASTISWGVWQTYSGSIPITTDGNYGVDFNATDNAGNAGDVNEVFVLVGPHGRLHTFNSSGKPRSFFSTDQNVTLRIDTNMSFVPTIKIIDSNGTTVLSAGSMTLSGTATDYNSFDYNYTLNGTSGWYDAIIGAQYFSKVFYQGEVWTNRHTDSNGNIFPFSFDLNITEPNNIQHWFTPIDTNVTFNYGADANSIRVIDCNQTNSCIEIPSQIYNSTITSGLVTSTNLVFLVSIDKGEIRHFEVSYSSESHSKTYTTDLNTTQRGFTFDINNSSYLTTIDINKGGSITKIKNNNGSNTDINGSNPMFYSPYVAAGLTVYGPQNLANPLFSVDTNGPLTSIITVKGTVGGMDYNTRYTTYAKNSFFWYDENISSNQSGTSWDISDNFASFLPNKFNKFTNLFSNTLSTSDVNMLNNTLLINDVNFIGVYNKRSLDGVGAVFFTKQSSKSLSPTTTFYDQSVYAYWKRNIYSGIISSGDYFNSHGAVVVFNSWNGSGDLNDLFVQLSNPLSLVAGSEVVVDSNAPSLTTQGRVPSVVSDSVDLNCYATWHDDLLLDYVLVNVVGPDLNITNARLSARVKDYNAVYSVSASLLNAGDVNCVFTAYNVAAKTATATESVTVTDNTVPFVSGVTITPDSNVGVDPGADVIVDANVTEYTALRDVNLLVRIYDSNAGWGAWSSNAMTNDYSYGYTYHYTGDFNTTALVDSLWQYKIYSSDTLDHNSDSNVMSVYSYWDWTWSVTPTFFGVQSILFGEEATLGDLNVTNTGDKILRFMVSSDWDNKTQITYGGEAETSIGYRFYLNPKNSFGNSVLLPVKVGAKTVQSDTNFGIYVNALDSSASPTQTTTLARVVSYAGGPYLLIDWVDSNTSVTKGDTGLLYTVRVTNKGNEIATNPITIDWNYPTGWTLTSGALSTILDTNLAVDSYVSDSIGLTVSDSAVLGAQNITFTAGCCGDVNKTQTSTLAVTVNAAGTVVVTPTEEQGGAAGAGPGGGAGTGGGGGSIFSTAQEAEFFKTSERFELIRGKDDEFIVRVKNPFSDRNLLGLTASVSGLLSKYLEIVNPSIGDLGPGEEKSFTVKVAAPKYFDIGKHDLVFTINGILANGKGKKETKFTYENKVVLAVHDLNVTEAINIVGNGSDKVKELEKLGINVGPLKKLLLDANLRVGAEDYEGAKTNVESILSLAGTAVQVLNDLNTINESMNKSTANGIDTPKTMRLFTIAKLAFERGEYDKANLVLKDALLTLSLETKGTFNAGYFIVQNSAQIGIGIIVALFFLGSLFLYMRRALLKRRVGKLGYEENLLLSLMKELQKACFVDKKISMNEYQTALNHYENRLGEAVDNVINAQNELTNIVSLKTRTTKLNEERQRLIDEMRNTQTQYFKEGLIESRVYNSKQTNLGKRLGEVEKDITYSSAMKTIRINSSKIKTLWKLYYTIFK